MARQGLFLRVAFFLGLQAAVKVLVLPEIQALQAFVLGQGFAGFLFQNLQIRLGKLCLQLGNLRPGVFQVFFRLFLFFSHLVQAFLQMLNMKFIVLAAAKH